MRCPGRRGVACSASAADADVVDLFDAAKLTVATLRPHRPLVASRHALPVRVLQRVFARSLSRWTGS